MTQPEFAVVMGFISRTLNKPIPQEQAACYFALLGDLPLDAFQVAAQRALLESQYPALPTPGTLRKLATEAQRGNRLAPIEAWELVRKALARYGYYRQADGLASLPADVRRTAECIGWQSLCDASEDGVIRGQFCKAFEAQQTRTERESLLPPTLRQQVEGIGQAFALELEDKHNGKV